MPGVSLRSIRRRFPCTIEVIGYGNQDAFGDIAAGCRKLGMNVIARTDSHACHQDAYDAHPSGLLLMRTATNVAIPRTRISGSPVLSDPTTSSL